MRSQALVNPRVGATLQDRGEKTDWVGVSVREPHVGATREGRSLSFRKRGEEDPAELKGEESGPQSPSSSRRGWGNPSVRPPRPPFPFLPVPGGRGWRAEPGARRGRSGPRPRGSGASRPLQLGAGLPLGPPTDPPWAPTRGPLGLPFRSWVVHLWVPGPCARLVGSFSWMTPLPTHPSASPFPWSLRPPCGDFLNTAPSILVSPPSQPPSRPQTLCSSSRVCLPHLCLPPLPHPHAWVSPFLFPSSFSLFPPRPAPPVSISAVSPSLFLTSPAPPFFFLPICPPLSPSMLLHYPSFGVC